MIVECPRCESDVDARILGTHDLEDADGPPWRLTLAACPLCGQPLLGSQEMVQNGGGEWDWTGAVALWPTPELRPHADIPEAIRDCLEEAHRCFKAKAFYACEVMVGRALEGLCFEHTGESSLGRGLRVLRDKGIIDGRLYDWSESLRDGRDRGAPRTTLDDARDMLDFALVACEYVYVLSKKYAHYRERKGLPAPVARSEPRPAPVEREVTEPSRSDPEPDPSNLEPTAAAG
jgi:hypothetical protein